MRVDRRLGLAALRRPAVWSLCTALILFLFIFAVSADVAVAAVAAGAFGAFNYVLWSWRRRKLPEGTDSA
jgi:hypothetical protein